MEEYLKRFESVEKWNYMACWRWEKHQDMGGSLDTPGVDQATNYPPKEQSPRAGR